MAITKIMNIGAGKKGKITNHLKNALDYIMNDAKTDMCPMEKTVVDIHDPTLALKELNITMMRLRGQSKE